MFLGDAGRVRVSRGTWPGRDAPSRGHRWWCSPATFADRRVAISGGRPRLTPLHIVMPSRHPLLATLPTVRRSGVGILGTAGVSRGTTPAGRRRSAFDDDDDWGRISPHAQPFLLAGAGPTAPRAQEGEGDPSCGGAIEKSDCTACQVRPTFTLTVMCPRFSYGGVSPGRPQGLSRAVRDHSLMKGCAVASARPAVSPELSFSGHILRTPRDGSGPTRGT